MAISIKNNQVIVKNDRVAADCSCCVGWYCVCGPTLLFARPIADSISWLFSGKTKTELIFASDYNNGLYADYQHEERVQIAEGIRIQKNYHYGFYAQHSGSNVECFAPGTEFLVAGNVATKISIRISVGITAYYFDLNSSAAFSYANEVRSYTAPDVIATDYSVGDTFSPTLSYTSQKEFFGPNGNESLFQQAIDSMPAVSISGTILQMREFGCS